MFKHWFLPSETETMFKLCKIDHSHSAIAVKQIVGLAKRYFKQASEKQEGKLSINIVINDAASKQISISIDEGSKRREGKSKASKKKEEFIGCILKKMRSQNEVLRIKMLIVCHSIIVNTQDSQFIKTVDEEMDRYIVEGEQKEKRRTGGGGKLFVEKIERYYSQDEHQFIAKHIISFYCQYLKRVMLGLETYRFVRQFLSKSSTEYDWLEILNKGFVVLNLINFLLKSQESLCKMGRYYPDYQQMLSLYVAYLQDLIVYHAFIKEVLRVFRNEQISDGEIIRHHYLFITEAQKSCDKLYEYFHNRYYYRRVIKIIQFPQFLVLESREFKQITRRAKKFDREMVALVKKSKYGNGQRQLCKTVLNKDEETEIEVNKTAVYSRAKQDYKSLEDIFGDELKSGINSCEQTVSIVYKFNRRVQESMTKLRDGAIISQDIQPNQ